jgi:hypothetical protein
MKLKVFALFAALFLSPLSPAHAVSDCDNCLKTCKGTCAKHGDSCFCYETLEPIKNTMDPIHAEDPELVVKGARKAGPKSKPDKDASNK